MRKITLIVLLALAVGCKSEPTETAETPTTTPAAETTAEAPEPETTEAESDADGLELPMMAEPFDGVVTSGQPNKDAFLTLKEHGVTAVINLRPHSEIDWDEPAMSEQAGVHYINIPIGSAADLTKENVVKFDAAMTTAEAAEGKTLVHCGSSNRVGAMFALRAGWLQKTPPAEAIEKGKKAGLTKLEPNVEKLLAGE